MTEIESIINVWPITRMYVDQESLTHAPTPSHLIYGRMIAMMPKGSHFKIVCTNNTLTRKVKRQRNLFRQLTKQWWQDYLLNLREDSIAKRTILLEL